jgi:hypothetical protein
VARATGCVKRRLLAPRSAHKCAVINSDRHREEQSGEAIHLATALDCFAYGS